MFDISHQFATNQLLVAGVGTTIAATLAMRARALVARFKGLVRDQLVSTLTARTNGASVARLTRVIAQHRLHASAAAYSIGEDNALTIGYGTGAARWQGIYIWYSLYIDTSVKSWDPIEVLELTFLTRDRSVLDRFVKLAQTGAKLQELLMAASGPEAATIAVRAASGKMRETA